MQANSSLSLKKYIVKNIQFSINESFEFNKDSTIELHPEFTRNIRKIDDNNALVNLIFRIKKVPFRIKKVLFKIKNVPFRIKKVLFKIKNVPFKLKKPLKYWLSQALKVYIKYYKVFFKLYKV